MTLISNSTVVFETTLRHPHSNASREISGLSVNITIGRSGLISDNSRAASSPFITGIERSRRTKSGLRSATFVNCLATVAGFPANNPIGNTFKHEFDGVPHGSAVIHNQNVLRHSLRLRSPFAGFHRADTVAEESRGLEPQNFLTIVNRPLTRFEGTLSVTAVLRQRPSARLYGN